MEFLEAPTMIMMWATRRLKRRKGSVGEIFCLFYSEMKCEGGRWWSSVDKTVTVNFNQDHNMTFMEWTSRGASVFFLCYHLISKKIGLIEIKNFGFILLLIILQAKSGFDIENLICSTQPWYIFQHRSVEFVPLCWSELANHEAK